MVGRWIALAEVAKLGQRRWDEVPVLSGSQVQILPSAPNVCGGVTVPNLGCQLPDSEGICGRFKPALDNGWRLGPP